MLKKINHFCPCCMEQNKENYAKVWTLYCCGARRVADALVLLPDRLAGVEMVVVGIFSESILITFSIWSYFQCHFDHIFNVNLIIFSMSIQIKDWWTKHVFEENNAIALWKNRCKPNIYSYCEKIHCTGKYWKDIWKRRCGDSPLEREFVWQQ